LANITYPASLTNNTTADADQVMAFFNAITAQVNGNIEAANMANLTITGAKIANDTITATQIAADAITQSELGPLSVGTPELIDLGVTGAKIANDTVTATQIASDAITQSELGPLSVGTPELIDLAVSTAKIANNAVNLGKLSLLASTTSGSSTLTTTGNFTPVTVTPVAGTYLILATCKYANLSGSAGTCSFNLQKDAANYPTVSGTIAVTHSITGPIATANEVLAVVDTLNGSNALRVQATRTGGGATDTAAADILVFGPKTV
jgi:hypothetical protein